MHKMMLLFSIWRTCDFDPAAERKREGIRTAERRVAVVERGQTAPNAVETTLNMTIGIKDKDI